MKSTPNRMAKLASFGHERFELRHGVLGAARPTTVDDRPGCASKPVAPDSFVVGATVQNVCLSLNPGGRIALVGGSGSGKSTVGKLVCGLYDPWEGEVLIDGRPRAEHAPHSLTSSIAWVDQEVFLFEGTVRENLSMWNPLVPEAQLVAAAKDACVHDDIVRLRGGYEAHVEEGGRNFSGGQRQRLEIARALVNNPSVVILDEATSALDPETEKKVDDNLRRRGCTLLIIAHRLSTTRDADEIVVFERGKIVERGVFLTDNQYMQGLWRAELDGDPFSSWGSANNNAAPLAAFGDVVVWGDQSGTYKASASSSGTTTVMAVAPARVYSGASGSTRRSVAVDGSYIYSANDTDIFKCPIESTCLSSPATAASTALPNVVAMTIYADTLYALGGSPFSSTGEEQIWSVPTSGGAPTTLSAQVPGEPTGTQHSYVLLADENALFWNSYNGDIYTCARSNCEAELLVPGAGSPTLAQDTGSLYWVSPADGAIYRMAKP